MYKGSLDVRYKGKKVGLNRRLILQQELDDSLVVAIKELHHKRLVLLDEMERQPSTPALKAFANQITEIDFDLQEAWGFKRDNNYHKFWDLPHCACPKLDNDDAYPLGYYIMTEECPIHGFHRRDL